MSTYEFMSEPYGFQLTIPDSWSGSLLGRLWRFFSGVKRTRNALGSVSLQTTLSGPHDQHLHIVVDPLSPGVAEPTLDETREFYANYAYRRPMLSEVDTGTIRIGSREHFWAKYYLHGAGQPVLVKKYAILVNRVEYVLTARLGSATDGHPLVPDDVVKSRESVYDEIVSSFRLTH